MDKIRNWKCWRIRVMGERSQGSGVHVVSLIVAVGTARDRVLHQKAIKQDDSGQAHKVEFYGHVQGRPWYNFNTITQGVKRSTSCANFPSKPNAGLKVQRNRDNG